jgi:glycosyltransferase involved in cell wall biosynthesis
MRIVTNTHKDGPNEASTAKRGSSISIIVAALNEEAQLEATVKIALSAAERHFEGSEVLVFDDGSTDRTGEIADALAAAHPTVRAFHHGRPLGLGGVFWRGVDAARMERVVLLNGKNDTPEASLDAIFALRDEADLVIPYTLNSHERPIGRRVLSRTFVFLLNRICGHRLHYYNHSVLYRREMLRSLSARSESYAFEAEALIGLLRRGHGYVDVGVMDRFAPGRRTRAFRGSNVLGVSRFLAGLWWETRGPGRGR